MKTHQEVCVIEAISDQCVLVLSQTVFLQPLPDTQNPPRVYQTARNVDACIRKYWYMKINKNILIIPHFKKIKYFTYIGVIIFSPIFFSTSDISFVNFLVKNLYLPPPPLVLLPNILWFLSYMYRYMYSSQMYEYLDSYPICYKHALSDFYRPHYLYIWLNWLR